MNVPCSNVANPSFSGRRRFLRFSLRSLLVATAIVGVFLGWVAYEVRRGRELEQAIRELNLMKFTTRSPIPTWLRTVLGEYFLARVERGVGFANTKQLVTLAHVERLQLVELNLDGTNVADASLSHIEGMASLEFLELYGTNVTDAGLARLQGLTGLRSLHLSGTRITDTGLAHLRVLRNLEELSLTNLPITDAGLEHLSGLANLKKLSLDGTNITGAGLGSLKHLAKLINLKLNGTKIDDAGLVHLQGLSRLEYLSLHDTNITDAGLPHLQGLRNCRDLKHINLTGSLVTPVGIRKLREVLPFCHASCHFDQTK